MLQDNIRNFRIKSGLSQEELARRLNVVRQTVSKWENNLSVPDAESLIRLSEVFGVPVSILLGESIEPEAEETELQQLAHRLEQINDALAQHRIKRQKYKRICGLCLIAAAVIWIICAALPLRITPDSASIGIIGGADGPTAIFVSGINWVWTTIGSVLSLAALVIGIILLIKTRKK